MSKKAKFIEEFVITAGKGMKRKAIRKAFQNLNECGVGVTASFFNRELFDYLKAFDYLSQVHVISARTDEQLIETVKDHQMIETTINDLMDKLKWTYATLKELFE